ncbi:helix-turn-helix domain-containing protein [Nonomuraea typhae]|uniref:nSTAND1 domain-containing NTPase n=1 Tax=Nonomuraea typhae TaxID=2603600 RepID=UPI0015E22295|nr:helix-turn-helix domain-containing protein [Nonomuraea typhae]
MDGQRPAFGGELRKWRTLRGISLARLAELVHYSKGYLSKIENSDKRPTPELAHACDRALGADGALVRLAPAKPAGGECPYPGLDAFGPGSAQWYFGRDEATAELTMRLASRMDGGGPLIVVAPSGAGKSSLLGAGLLPALARGALPRAGSSEWPVTLFTPTARPMERLTGILAGLRAPKAVLVADQFEETFTLCPAGGEREQFVRTLSDLAASGRALVVLGVRADYYGHLLAYPELVAALRGGQLALPPMSETQLRAAIVQPAAAAGLRLEPGLVELLLRDLGLHRDGAAAPAEPPSAGGSAVPGAGAREIGRIEPEPLRGSGACAAEPLPLLAHALRALWQQREDGALTVAGYHRTGGIRGAVTTTAEDVYAAFDAQGREVARRLLPRLVRLDPDGGRSRLRLPLARLPAEQRPVLDALVAARLLTVDAAGVSITHEALLGAWPRLRDWIETDRAGLQARRRLGAAAEAWQQAGRDPSFTYRGASLALAREWAGTHPDELDPVEAEFLRAGEHEERRGARKQRRRAVAVTALAVAAAMTASGVAWQIREARIERDEVISQQVATAANSLRANDAPLAAGLSVAAWRRAETPESLGALLGSSGFPEASRESAGSGRITVLAASRDGRSVVTGDSAQEVWLRRAGQEAVRLPWDLGAVTYAGFRGDGQAVAVAGMSGVRHWSLANLAAPVATHKVPGISFAGFSGPALAVVANGELLVWKGATPERSPQGNRVMEMTSEGPVDTDQDSALAALSPDGKWVAAARQNKAWLVELASGKRTDLATTGFIYSLDFSPDGRTVAAGTTGPGVRLWSVPDGRLLTDLVHPAEVRALAFVPGDGSLLTGITGGTVYRWSRLPAARPHTSEILAMATGRQVMATGDEDGQVGLWSLDGALLGTAREHDGAVNNVALAPGLMASASDDDSVGIWDTTRPGGPHLLRRFTGHGTNVAGVALSPDGRVGASVCEDGQVLLWDPATGAPLGRLQGIQGVTDVVIREGRLAVGDGDGNVQVWDISRPGAPRRLRVLTGHIGYSDDLDWHPDGRYLAGAGHDGAVLIWDLADPRATPATRLTGHTGIVRNVSFDPASGRIATIGADRSLRIWQDGRLQAIWQTRGNALRFLPGGALVSADDGGELRRWALSPEPVAQRICALDPSPLSAGEWARYVSGGGYAAPCREG